MMMIPNFGLHNFYGEYYKIRPKSQPDKAMAVKNYRRNFYYVHLEDGNCLDRCLWRPLQKESSTNSPLRYPSWGYKIVSYLNLYLQRYRSTNKISVMPDFSDRYTDNWTI